ncbi:MAG: biosynthetic peptidoglycan transglycosylase [Bacilli bacterium]
MKDRKRIIKKRETTNKSSKKDTDVLVLLAAITLIIIIIGCLTLGVFFTCLLIGGIGIICGISYFLRKNGFIGNAKTKKRKIFNIIVMFFLGCGILGCIAFGGFMVYVVSQAPKFDIKQLDAKEPSIMYGANNEVIAMLGSEMREKVSYDDLPQVLIDAIVATEDSRFFQHNGFDAPRFLKATLGQIAGNSDAGGASTLSMQVIKNSFTSSDDSGINGLIRKFTDIYLAIFKLEKNYSNEEIL